MGIGGFSHWTNLHRLTGIKPDWHCFQTHLNSCHTAPHERMTQSLSSFKGCFVMKRALAHLIAVFLWNASSYSPPCGHPYSFLLDLFLFIWFHVLWGISVCLLFFFSLCLFFLSTSPYFCGIFGKALGYTHVSFCCFCNLFTSWAQRRVCFSVKIWGLYVFLFLSFNNFIVLLTKA